MRRMLPSARRRPGGWRILRYPWSVAGLAVLVVFVSIGLLAPILAPHDPMQGNLRARLLPPFWVDGGMLQHPLGTDQLGRDVMSRLMHGARASLAVGFGVVMLSGIVGGVLGLIAGYFGGTLDDVLARMADWTLAFPFLVLAILLMGVLGPGLVNLTLVLALAGWPQFFRLMRGEALVERQKAYVEASIAIGRGPAGVIVFSILRNVFHIFFVLATIRLGIAILSEASLSFLGFGVPSHIPAWGSMISAGQAYVSTAWWLSTVPGVAILLLVLAVNLFGEGLRDATDPRLRD